MKAQVIPAVLTKNFSDIEAKAVKFKGVTKLIQIDICDGKFVDTSTWPFIKGKSEKFKDDFEMPFWETVDYELDLMVAEPQNYIENFKNIGMAKCILHTGSSTIENIVNTAKVLDSYDIEVGVAININSKFENFKITLEKLTEESIPFYVQVMGVSSIGKQGEGFTEDCLPLVSKIKDNYPDVMIQVDGAVSETTIKKLYNVGATSFVVGSWFDRSTLDSKSSIQHLLNLL